MMEAYMRGSSRMVKDMAKESRRLRVLQSIRENGSMVILKERESLFMLMEKSMKEILSMIKEKVTERTITTLVISIKGSGRMARKKDMG
jgi:hypothetical protein